MSWKSAKSSGRVRVGIYTRFSSDMQNPTSCGDQERECRARAAKEPGWEVVMVERDESVRAGAKAERHGLARILSAVERGDLDVLLVFEVSRFSRDVFDGMADLSRLRKKGVGFADARSGEVLDLADSFGQMRLMFGLVTSEQETSRLGARSKYGQQGQVEKGFSGGGQPPYGYSRQPIYSETEKDLDGHPKRIGVRFVPSESQRPIVELIYRLYAEGWAKGAIARHLNETGIPTKRAGAQRAGRSNSGAWSAAGIKTILENDIYKGVRTWNRHSRLGGKLPSSGKKRLEENPPEAFVVVPNWVEPLVDVALWEEVELRRKADGEEYARKHTAAKGRNHLLSGFLVCGSCGSRLILAGHKHGESCYRCGLNKRGGGRCQNGQLIPAKTLERIFVRSLDVAVKDPAQLAALVAEHNRQVDNANEGQYSIIRGIEERLRDARARTARLVEAITCSGGEIPVLVSKLQESESEVTVLEEQVAAATQALQAKLVPRPHALEAYQAGQASIFSGEVAKDRGIIERLVKRIVVSVGGQVAVNFLADGLFGPVLEHLIDARHTDGETCGVDLAEGRLRAWASMRNAHALARRHGHPRENVVPHTRGGNVKYWVHVGGSEPVADDNDLGADLPDAQKKTVFPAVVAGNTVGDPNGSLANLHLEIPMDLVVCASA